MSQRKVFGRLQFEVDGKLVKLELRRDGLWVREHRRHKEWLVPLAHVLRLCKRDTELFTEAEMTNKCDHKFVDSNHCLKCGWEPPRTSVQPVTEVANGEVGKS